MNQIEKVARALCDDAGCVWDHDPQSLSRIEWRKAACAAIAAMPVQAEPVATRWQLGDKVKKKANSSWRGVVCGFYNTPATPNGYSVVSLYEPGSVQVWPEAALEDWDGVMVEDELRAEITRLTEALRAAEERGRDAVMSAYCTGATDVHNSWVEGTNGGEADFSEAASDYYSSIKGN